jgi:hypothetical protein
MSPSEPRPSRKAELQAAIPPAPTAKGRKAGLTEESFKPSDDILEKLRLAAEGELDPSVLRSEPEEPPPAEPAPLPPPELTEAERRVLERLRRQELDDAGPDSGFS